MTEPRLAIIAPTTADVLPPPTDGITRNERTGAYLLRVGGLVQGGAATDASGAWTWWHVSTQGRRVVVGSEEEAVAALRRAST